jgi:hypothetical protein
VKLALPVLMAALVICRAAAQTPKAPPTSKKDECTIAGTVVTMAGSEPLKKARVLLQSVEDRTRTISVLTDSGGRFEYKRLEPGRYRLSVNRVGFVGQVYGQRRPDDPGAVLALRAGPKIK